MGLSRCLPPASLAIREDFPAERPRRPATARRRRSRYRLLFQSRRGFGSNHTGIAAADRAHGRIRRWQHRQQSLSRDPGERFAAGCGDGCCEFPDLAGSTGQKTGPERVGRFFSPRHGSAQFSRPAAFRSAAARRSHAAARPARARVPEPHPSWTVWLEQEWQRRYGR